MHFDASTAEPWRSPGRDQKIIHRPVSEGLAASRPRVAARLIVDVDDEFTHDHSVCEGNDSRVTFEFTVHYEPRYQTFMNSATLRIASQTNSLFRSIFVSLWIVAIGVYSDL